MVGWESLCKHRGSPSKDPSEAIEEYASIGLRLSFASLAFFIIITRYSLHLHFKCYPKSPLYPAPALLPNPPTPASWPRHSPVLGHMIFARPRASPPIDG